MFRSFLQRLIKCGRLSLVLPDGEVMRFGDGAGSGDGIVVRLRGRLTPLKLAVHPDLYLGQSYMDGDLVVEQGSLVDLLDLLGRNLAIARPAQFESLLLAARRSVAYLLQVNPRTIARRNVAHHYHLPGSLYTAFLDEDLQYSCAYFPTTGATLEEAQVAKKRRIAAKLLLEPGMRVLDIGSGWGGLALHLARTADVEVLGVTLSEEQVATSRERAVRLGLGDQVRFELLDYRDVEGTFDRIVSVGMLEHVGARNYDAFFATVAKLLEHSGVALVHSIGRAHGPSYTSDWIRKYIFPGGYAPALSEVLPSIERGRLWLTDLEVLRLHYAETLVHWRQRFLASRGRLADVCDERFCRMWEFYLAASEMSFRHGGLMVFQAQVAREVDAVAMTRTYMANSLTDAEPGAVPPRVLAAT